MEGILLESRVAETERFASKEAAFCVHAVKNLD